MPESHYRPKDYKPDLNLSCGNCKAIRVFSGEPLKCNVCGWECNTPPPIKNTPLRVTTEEEFFRPIVGCVGKLLAVALVIGVLLGGLWLLVALVKYMWQHS